MQTMMAANVKVRDWRAYAAPLLDGGLEMKVKNEQIFTIYIEQKN